MRKSFPMAIFYSFAAFSLQIGIPAELSPKEFHHLFRVLRVTPRDEIYLFDGNGTVAKCRRETFSVNKMEIIPENIRRFSKPKPEIHLLQAMAKSPAMDLILRQATELGTARISPVETDFSEVHLSDLRRESRQQRWKTVALEACKQSKNPFLPEISPLETLAEFLQESRADDFKILASLQNDAIPWRDFRPQIAQNKGAKICIAIGPEGDFSPREYDVLKRDGFRPISLGLAILTTETAAISLLGALRLEICPSHLECETPII